MDEVVKVFISYSWSSPSHEEWVVNFAERLMSDGIDVVLDKWNLKEGQDKYTFMERMVNSHEINKVLMVLDKKYVEKADGRKGGVGTETLIISPEIYHDALQEKFIPIVTEIDEEGKAYLPAYLGGRIYIDLSVKEHFEEEYEKLLRNLYKRPQYTKPKRGQAPTYLFEETPMSHKTSIILRTFDNKINESPKRANSLLKDFLSIFFQDVKEYTIVFSDVNELNVGKQICDNINSYTPLRNDFIEFFNKVTSSDIEFDVDILIRFLEDLFALLSPQDNRSSWMLYSFDNFKFIIRELFLYLIAIGLKNENYKFVKELLYSVYFPKDKYVMNNEAKKFDIFNLQIPVISKHLNKITTLVLISSTAELMITRIYNRITLQEFVEADILCHYIGVLNNIHWAPISYIYMDNKWVGLFQRLISARHFEKVKTLFDVETPHEFKDKLSDLAIRSRDIVPFHLPHAHFSLQPLYKLINIETLASVR